MLALSATPGTDVTKVQDVINELHIAHIEVITAWVSFERTSTVLVVF